MEELSQIVGPELYEETMETLWELYPDRPEESFQTANFNGIVELLMKAGYEESGLSPEYGIDVHFADRAYQDKKTISGVETYAQQAEDIAKYPPDYYEYMLRGMLEPAASAESEVLTFEKWCQGDLEWMEETQVQVVVDAKDESELARFLYEFVLGEHNDRMVTKAQEYLESGETTFFIAGLAHMLGERGIVEQLRTLGYEVNLVELPQ